MQTGWSIQELATEVQRQNDVKADYISPAKKLRVVPEGGGGKAQGVALELADQGTFQMGRTFHTQLATKLKIPQQYYDRCLESEAVLLADNVNHWLQRENTRRMVRTLDGKARAYLSDGYRPLDNFDLCEAVLPPIFEMELKVVSCRVTERRLYIQVVSESIGGEVKVGDFVQAGLTISNSEIGSGAFNLEEFLYRLECLNGQVGQSILRKYHTGSRAGGMFDAVQAFYRDSTKRLDDAAFFAKVTDTVRHALSEERFGQTLLRLQGAAEIQLEPVQAVELVAKRFEFSDKEKSSVLNFLAIGGDMSVWGMANAVTRLAHKADDYDRNIEYQKLGDQVIELKKSDWQTMDALAA